MLNLQFLLLSLASLTLVLVGIGVIIVTSFFPLLSLKFLSPAPPLLPYITAISVVQIIHLRLLWISENHLAAYRWLWLPIRRLLLPLVMLIARFETSQEEVPTVYLKVSDLTVGEDTEKDILLKSFRPSVRRRYKQMEKTFRSHNIRHVAVQSESSLRLAQVVPILWQHERRQCKLDGKNVVEEFIKRFLVITVVPDGLLDLFYQDDKLVAIQMSIQQNNVLHWFMYFSKDSVTKSGIWFNGILLAMMRGLKLQLDYVNGQGHHTDSKIFAGFLPAEHADDELLSELFPWSFSQAMTESATQTSLWKD